MGVMYENDWHQHREIRSCRMKNYSLIPFFPLYARTRTWNQRRAETAQPTLAYWSLYWLPVSNEYLLLHSFHLIEVGVVLELQTAYHLFPTVPQKRTGHARTRLSVCLVGTSTAMSHLLTWLQTLFTTKTLRRPFPSFHSYLLTRLAFFSPPPLPWAPPQLEWYCLSTETIYQTLHRWSHIQNGTLTGGSIHMKRLNYFPLRKLERLPWPKGTAITDISMSTTCTISTASAMWGWHQWGR